MESNFTIVKHSVVNTKQCSPREATLSFYQLYIHLPVAAGSFSRILLATYVF